MAGRAMLTTIILTSVKAIIIVIITVGIVPITTVL